MKYDFSGYITRNDIVCSDGRVIRHDAFKDQDGTRVPLVYQHMHNDINNVLGFVDMENRPDGVYGYGSFNGTPNAQIAKTMVQHGDLNSMSIYANQLIQSGTCPVNVTHGRIREVSLVLSGANPGATIDQVSMEHSDGSTDFLDEAIIHTGLQSVSPTLAHADTSTTNQNGSTSQQSESGGNQTVGDVWNTFSDDEKNVVLSVIAATTGVDIAKVAGSFGNLSVPSSPKMLDPDVASPVYDGMDETKKKIADYLVGTVLEEINKALENDPNTTTAQHADFREDSNMKYNVFESNGATMEPVISHDALNDFVATAKSSHAASLKDLADSYEFTTTDGQVIQHDDVNRTHALTYGIQDIEYLFPDYAAESTQPHMIARDQTWVADFMDGSHKAPMSRIKSVAANITADEARAKGYITGREKQNEVFPLLKRTTDPQTVYKKQKLDRDDLIDITDFDVVVWLKAEMQTMLREEIARAALVGDGRAASSDDKISPEHIRPIYGDSDVYTIYQAVTDETLGNADGLVDLAVQSRKTYKGSGSPVLYATNDIITMLLLARDKMGRRLYQNISDLASAMRVSRIVEVPVLEGITRKAGSKTMGLLGIIVNPKDYTFGATRGGEENFFDDFDIDFNQYKYLIEARTSGTLTVPYSAIALEYDTSAYQIGNGVLAKKGTTSSGS